MHILVAPNAFKNSLAAEHVAEAIARGLHQSKLSCATTCFPIADGGDGTAELLINYLKADLIQIKVHDPLERQIESSFGWIEHDRVAIIELASASGLRLLTPTEYNPLEATTYGTGELILEALNRNAARIILCIGGSATVDGGTGILRALGLRFYDSKGNTLDKLPSSLSSVVRIDMSELDPRVLNTELTVLCDVDNPLLGATGAASVFGPQKGARDTDISSLEDRLCNFRNVVLATLGKDLAAVKHGGAAGGVAAALSVVLNARLVNGIDYFLEACQFDAELKKADLVITGEGWIDQQTLHGKGPFGVAKRAKEFSIPVIGMAGRVPDKIDGSLGQYFTRLISINDDTVDLQTAIKNTYTRLEKSAKNLGDWLHSSPVQNL